jgi:hypothetical protein
MPREPIYEEQLTAFIDFLGFSETSFADPERTTEILRTLQYIASYKSEPETLWEGKKGQSRFRIVPATSTFSDHIVMSYPMSELRSITDETSHVALSLALIDLRNRVGMIAASAFPLGFLIRGGITLGGLYHSAGVVFGEGLVEAYRLESEWLLTLKYLYHRP